jgi:hypothetical protein
MLSLLMTSTQMQNEALPLALPDMKLCVNVLRGCTRWSASVQDSSHPTPFIGIRLFPPSETTADCSCLPWSATLRPWKGELLLKSLNTLTLSADLFESLKIAVTICFSGQGCIDVSFPHPHRFQKAKSTQIKYMNDRAIARLKANISRIFSVHQQRIDRGHC